MITIEERKACYLLWLEDKMGLPPALRQELAEDFVKSLQRFRQDLLTEVGENIIKERDKILKEIDTLRKAVEDRTRTAVAWMNLCHEAEAKLKPEGIRDPHNPFLQAVPDGWPAFNRIPDQARLVVNAPEYIYADVPCKCHQLSLLSNACPRHSPPENIPPPNLGIVVSPEWDKYMDSNILETAKTSLRERIKDMPIESTPETVVYKCDRCLYIYTKPLDPCPCCRNKNYIPGTMKDFGINVKRGKMQPTEVALNVCQNCGGTVIRDTCMQCGQSEKIGAGRE